MDPYELVRILLIRQDKLIDQLPEPARTEYRILDSALRIARAAAYEGREVPPALHRLTKLKGI